jgi:hypothetical protein
LGGNIRGLGGLALVPIGGFQGSCCLLRRRKACEAWIVSEEEGLLCKRVYGSTVFIENYVVTSIYLEYGRGMASIGLVLIPTGAMADLHSASFHSPADPHPFPRPGSSSMPKILNSGNKVSKQAHRTRFPVTNEQ